MNPPPRKPVKQRVILLQKTPQCSLRGFSIGINTSRWEPEILPPSIRRFVLSILCTKKRYLFKISQIKISPKIGYFSLKCVSI